MTGTGTGQEHHKKGKPAPSQDWQTLGRCVSTAAVEVMKPPAHCTAKETFSETMGDMPEATLRVVTAFGQENISSSVFSAWPDYLLRY